MHLCTLSAGWPCTFMAANLNAPEQTTAPRSLEVWNSLLSCASMARAAKQIQPTLESANDSAESPTKPNAAAATIPQASLVDSFLLTISRQAMACEWEVLLNQHQYSQGAEDAMRALDLVEQLESMHSVFRTHSDFSAINRFGATRPVAVSVDTLKMLELALDIYRITEGAFDITAGSLSQAWGFSRRAGRMPTQAEIDKALQAVGSQYIEVDPKERLVSLVRTGVTLNPGGIGKGYALDRAGGRLISSGIVNFMMHGGLSSVVAQGDRQHSETGGGWLVSLKHPWRWEEPLGMIRLRDCALATSGSGKQFFHFQGQRYSHIIDPRSGWPAQGMMSTTVLCESAAVADALATALFVMGPQQARLFCEAHPCIAAILVFTDAKSGSMRIETHNVPTENWMPVR